MASSPAGYPYLRIAAWSDVNTMPAYATAIPALCFRTHVSASPTERTQVRVPKMAALRKYQSHPNGWNEGAKPPKLDNVGTPLWAEIVANTSVGFLVNMSSVDRE